MIEVFPVRTPTLPPATHTNVYRVGSVVIDPGSPWADEQERLAEALRDGPAVTHIVLTHHHHDHTGGVEDLARRTGAKVCAHEDARVAFPVDVHLREGDLVPTGGPPLRCLHTPGHADGHLALQVVDTGDVLVGDLLAGVGTIVLAPPEGHLRTFLRSLERVARVAKRAFPAHGPTLQDAPAAIEAVIAHRHARSQQVEAALLAGATTAREVATVVSAGVPGVDLKLAAAQALAHLQWLAEEGLAREEDGRWRRVVARAPDAALSAAGELLAALLREHAPGAGPTLRVLPGGREGSD